MSVDTSLNRIYDDHGTSLYGFLLNLTRNEADARDLLQEIFRKLARQPALLENIRNPRAFLLRLAHNLAVDWIRRRTAREQATGRLRSEALRLFADSEDPDAQTFRVELGNALATLPPDQRSVVHLKLWEGLTFEAIAEILVIPLNTAASRYRYGLDKLRTRLRPLYAEIR